MMITEHWFALAISDHPKKMSETLQDYARPLLDRLPPDYTLEELKAAILLAAALWDVVDIEGIRNAIAELSTRVPPRLRVPTPKAMAIIRRMLTRKREEFGDDHRLALDVDVVREGAGFSVKAIGVGPNPEFGNWKAKA
jgi:hypothetical protein